MHRETIYMVVLMDIVKADLMNLKQMFTEALIKQLYSDGILLEEKEPLIRKFIGEINIRSTDNNLSASASLNDAINRLERWKDKKDYLKKIKWHVEKNMNAIPVLRLNCNTASEVMSMKLNDIVGV